MPNPYVPDTIVVDLPPELSISRTPTEIMRLVVVRYPELISRRELQLIPIVRGEAK